MDKVFRARLKSVDGQQNKFWVENRCQCFHMALFAASVQLEAC